MKWLCNYIKECFCNHDFNLLREADVYLMETDKMPMYAKKTYMCKKCGSVKKVKC